MTFFDMLRILRLVFLCALILFFPWEFVSAGPASCETLQRNLMSNNAQNVIDNEIASNPFLSANPAIAAAWMAMLAQESAFNTQAVSNRGNKPGQDPIGSSFGLGQINYCSHQLELERKYKEKHPGASLPSGPATRKCPPENDPNYNERKRMIADWLVSDPVSNADLSADIFARAVRDRCGGNITEECLWKAVQDYNCNQDAKPGCGDPQYANKVRAYMDHLAKCGIGPQGSGITAPPPAGPPMTPSAAAAAGKCPDNGLNISLTEAMANFMKGTITAASNALSATPQTMPRDFKKATCFDYIQKFDEAMRIIINVINLQYGVIIDRILEKIKQMILDAVCAYIAQALNNALNSVCLPLPDLKLPGLGLPSLGAEHCNGLSLGDIIQFKPVPYGEVPPGPGRDIARGLLSRGGYTVPYQDKLPH